MLRKCKVDVVVFSGDFPALNALAVCNYMLGNEEEYRHWYRQAVASGSDAAKLKAYIVSLDPSL